VIYDWKTGQRRDEDRVQLHAYALHGSQVWGFAPEKISCIAVYLSEPVEEVPYAITREGLEEVVEIIRADLTRFRALDARKDDAEAFPVDPKPAVCAWCEFQEICPAVKRAPAHATAAPAPAPSGPAEEETA
jgi:CRISPR/Cas system-associated exonuclease Cas4 (RecB family)